MKNLLQEICDLKRVEVTQNKNRRTHASLEETIRATDPPRQFASALRHKNEKGEPGFITEIKKASPSAGLILSDFVPAQLAQQYEVAGAACLSVLTDSPYFQGRNEHLMEARAACSLPVLRKDFIIDVWQVAEARAIGADCVLLIMAALEDAEAMDLHAAAIHYGMDVLIEVHNRTELNRALQLPSGLLGINNRNLKTLSIDLQTTESLCHHVPTDRLLVSESGLKTAEDIKRLRSHGVHCFLIGESLLKQGDVRSALENLRI